MGKTSKLEKIILEENRFWSKVFDDELKSDHGKKFSSYWWDLYYKEISTFVKGELAEYSDPKILENGCGSGKASILLGKTFDRTLLDISSKALEYARFLVNKFDVNNVKFVKGNIFNLPFSGKSFDFIWNIGVIEHYDIEDIQLIVENMIRALKEGGKIIIAFPNFNSGPIIKARILKLKIFSKISGYRLGSEKKYKEKDLIKILEKAVAKQQRQILEIKVLKFGSPMIMETPKIFLQVFGRLIEKFFYNTKFLIFITVKIK